MSRAERGRLRGLEKAAGKRGEGEMRALARTGFTAVPYPLSLLGRISAAPALVSCNQLFSCLSHPKSKGCLWKPILWPCVRLAWSRLLVSIHQLDWMDTHDFMVKTGQPRRMADAVFEWKSRRNGKQEKADVSRRQEKARGRRQEIIKEHTRVQGNALWRWNKKLSLWTILNRGEWTCYS